MTPRISDHALLRWLERVHDIDMDHFRSKLAEIVEPYVKLKVKHVEIGGCWFVFDNGVLITVLPGKPEPRSNYRHDRQHANGTHNPVEKMHWKGAQRRRDHK